MSTEKENRNIYIEGLRMNVEALFVLNTTESVLPCCNRIKPKKTVARCYECTLYKISRYIEHIEQSLKDGAK